MTTCRSFAVAMGTVLLKRRMCESWQVRMTTCVKGDECVWLRAVVLWLSCVWCVGYMVYMCMLCEDFLLLFFFFFFNKVMYMQVLSPTTACSVQDLCPDSSTCLGGFCWWPALLWSFSLLWLSLSSKYKFPMNHVSCFVDMIGDGRLFRVSCSCVALVLA